MPRDSKLVESAIVIQIKDCDTFARSDFLTCRMTTVLIFRDRVKDVLTSSTN